jgi:hypothetical protein
MAAKIKLIKVDDTEYSIKQIGGVEGGELFDRLTQELGPAVIEGIRLALTSGGKATESVLAAVIVRAIVQLSPALKNDLRTKFAQLTTIDTGSLNLPLLEDGKKLQVGDSFDQHFAGRFPHMNKWLIAAMQWGFAGFLPSSGESADSAATTPTPSP